MSVQDDGLEMFLAEIVRRGGTATRRPGAETLIDVVAPTGRTHVVKLKTKQRGDWHAQKTDGRKRNTIRIDAWAFVDITQPVGMAPIVEAEWMRDNIRALVEKWLAADPSRDADRQRHHKIEEFRVADWAGRWDLIGLPDSSTPQSATADMAVTDDNLGAWVFTCNPRT